jgi:hypothetical protein
MGCGSWLEAREQAGRRMTDRSCAGRLLEVNAGLAGGDAVGERLRCGVKGACSGLLEELGTTANDEPGTPRKRVNRPKLIKHHLSSIAELDTSLSLAPGQARRRNDYKSRPQADPLSHWHCGSLRSLSTSTPRPTLSLVK